MLSDKNEDDDSSQPYFSVRWFSDWEGYGCVATQDVAPRTLIHLEEPFLKGHHISEALSLHNRGLLASAVGFIQDESPNVNRNSHVMFIQTNCVLTISFVQLDDKEYLRKKCGKTDEQIEKLWKLHDQHRYRYKDNSTCNK